MSQRIMTQNEINSYMKNLISKMEINKILTRIVKNVVIADGYTILNNLPLDLKENIKERVQRLRIKKLLKEIEAENQNMYKRRTNEEVKSEEKDLLKNSAFEKMLRKRRGNYIKKRREIFLKNQGKKNIQFWLNQSIRAREAGRPFNWTEYERSIHRRDGITNLEPSIVVPGIRTQPSRPAWQVPWITNRQRIDWGIPP